MKTKNSNKYVTFQLEDTKFAISVLRTNGIVEYGKITPVPEAPEYIEGVINLRGAVVPIVNLSKKFFKKNPEITESTSIMIVEPEIDGEEVKMGLVVDIVSDVMEIKEDHLEDPPKYGSKLKAEYLLKVASIEDDFIMILDIDKVLSQIEIAKDFTDQTNKVKIKKEETEEN